MNSARLFINKNAYWLGISFFVLVMGVMVFSLLIFIYASGLGLPSGSTFPKGEIPVTSLTELPPQAAYGIRGTVWHDVCDNALDTSQLEARKAGGCVQGADGEALANGIRDWGEPGIPGLLIWLGVGACPSNPTSSTQTAADGSFGFPELAPGEYCVLIDTFDPQNQTILLSGKWTKPRPDDFAHLVSQTVILQSMEGGQAVDFGWDFSQLPAPTPSELPTATHTPASSGCTDQAQFVGDVTYPDDSSLPPGTSFEKIWRIRNSGSCTWNAGYSLVFTNGQSMQSTSPIPLPGIVLPKSEVDLKVKFVAPNPSGTYRSEWMLQNPSGERFGIGEYSDKPIWVQIIVRPDGPTTTGAWRSEFFNNRDLTGKPAFTREDPYLKFNWGSGSPAGGIREDDFSARFSGDVSLDAATYRFQVKVDDGARLWVDGQLVIDEWKAGSSRTISGDLGLAKGIHAIRLEYFERAGNALVELAWSKVSNPSFSQWKAQYWGNEELSGNPALVRNDRAVDFNWHDEAPAIGLPADNFSVRWTRSLNFAAGTYRISAKADDGIRIFIDGARVLNEWHRSDGSRTYSVDRTLSGRHDFVVEYYENEGRAKVEVWWERLPPTPTPSFTPSPTLTLTHTPTDTMAPPSPTPTNTAPVEPTVTTSDTPEPTATETPTPTSTATDDSGIEPQIAGENRQSLTFRLR